MPTRPPDDGRYKVREGEWAGSIAVEFGYTDWEHDVWMRSENSDLRELRGDPHVLAPGDILFIPPWQDKQAACATAQRHTFQLKAPTEIFRLRIVDENKIALKNEQYELTLRYDPGGGSYKQANTKTDGSGQLQETIPSTTTVGWLKLPRLKQTIRLRFGYLTPMDLNNKELLFRGAQQRLLAIGFNPGPINSDDNASTRGAIKAFQQFCKDNPNLPHVTDPGPVDGILGPKTRKALITYFGA
ncbi:MAG TPA: peptidoglycan-binding protein [Phycisphaerae bacterium]|nr:peptidoglycan-binding protein [Phycisphaerae bacterium]